MPRRRRCRPTLRFLTEDLKIQLPPPETRLDQLRHPILLKAHGFAPSHPRNQIRIESIRDTMVYRFTHGRSRIATWLETHWDIVWVCAEDLRRDGAADDVYEYIERLHNSGSLLPDADDARRVELEDAFSFQDEIWGAAPRFLEQAERQAGEPLKFRLSGLQIECELLVLPEGDFEEVWLSVARISARGQHLSEKIQHYVFAVFKQVARGAEWEERRDWPTRSLEWYEVARLGVRERRG